MNDDTPLHPHLAGLNAFLTALAADVDPPTDAELRAYARTFDDPALDLWVLDDVTSLAERVRHTGVVHARLTGTKIKDLAQHLEVETRTVLRKYPLPKVEVRTVPEADPLELYQRVPLGVAPVVLELCLDTGELSVRCLRDDQEEAMARLERVDTGVWHRWDLPLLTPEGANDLMHKVRRLAQRMRFGADLRHDKAGTLHARLDADAEQARDDIGQLCADQSQGPHYLVELDGVSYFGSSAARTATDLDLTAAATAEQITAAAADAERQALEGGIIVLGTVEHLQGVVEQLEVDTELVLAIMEGPYTGHGDVEEYGLVEHLLRENTEITTWVAQQLPLLEEDREEDRWVAVTFDPVDTSHPSRVFEVDENTARELAQELAREDDRE